MRRGLSAVTFVALVVLVACWLVGSFFAPVLLAAAVVAAICIMVQLLASVDELLGVQPATGGALDAAAVACQGFLHLPATSTHSRLRQLSLATRRMLGLSLAATAIGYCTLLIATYLQLTPPSSLFPDFRELDRLLFSRTKPISQIERLLEATEGEMNRGGTMRPAFTEQSIDWESLTQSMSAEEKALLLAQREAERLALLDWVRKGASRPAYEADDHLVTDSAVAGITGGYLIRDSQWPPPAAPSRVRIRTLLADRCVTCHGENGRHDTARFITLDSYERLEAHLRPETVHSAGRGWVIAALIGLLPLAAVAVPTFYFTSYSPAARRLLLATTIVALGVMSACWFFGHAGTLFTSVLLTSAAVAAVAIIVQIAASLNELFVAE